MLHHASFDKPDLTFCMETGTTLANILMLRPSQRLPMLWEQWFAPGSSPLSLSIELKRQAGNPRDAVEAIWDCAHAVGNVDAGSGSIHASLKAV